MWMKQNNRTFQSPDSAYILCIKNINFLLWEFCFLFWSIQRFTFVVQSCLCFSCEFYLPTSNSILSLEDNEIHPCIIFCPQMLAQYLYLMSWTLCQHLISSMVDFSFIWPILIESCSSFSMSTSAKTLNKMKLLLRRKKAEQA